MQGKRARVVWLRRCVPPSISKSFGIWDARRTMRRTARWRLGQRAGAVHFGLVCLALAAACGGDTQANKPPTNVPNKDAGDITGSEPYDGSVPQPRPDSGAPNIPPGKPEKGLAGNCAVDSNKIFTVAERELPFTSTPLAVDASNSRFMIPFVETGDCLDTVHMASLIGAATGGEPTSNIAIDTCALVRDTAATALNDRWLVADTDNREAPYDIWITPYDAKTGAAAKAQRTTEDSQVETAIALSTLSDGTSALMAYASEAENAGQTLYVRPVDNLGRPTNNPVQLDASSDSSQLYFANLAMKPLGQGAGLVYVRYSLDFKTSDIVFVVLDLQGNPLREPWVLARNAGPSPSVDLTLDRTGGGIVYSRAEAMTGRQVWFQLLDAAGQAALLRTGTTRSPAQRIISSPARGIDVSITQLRASFVLGYRSLPQTDTGRAVIRSYFLDRNGAIVGSSDVSFTSTGGGRTNVQSAIDGRVVIGWNELNDNGGSALKVARLPCVGGQ
jgi:hypothetical protein